LIVNDEAKEAHFFEEILILMSENHVDFRLLNKIRTSFLMMDQEDTGYLNIDLFQDLIRKALTKQWDIRIERKLIQALSIDSRVSYGKLNKLIDFFKCTPNYR
jgi:Ca2+-binding EF-hand superfamily protein